MGLLVSELEPILASLSISEYRARVESARAANDGTPIFNGSPLHARIVISTLLKSAKSKVSVVCRALSNDVWGDDEVIGAARLFLEQPGSELRILTENALDCTTGSNRFRDLVTSASLKVRRMKDTLKPSTTLDIVVADYHSYRIESDRDMRSAVVVFGNADVATKANRLFDALWINGENCDKAAQLA